jgi:hypothetical protein
LVSILFDIIIEAIKLIRAYTSTTSKKYDSLSIKEIIDMSTTVFVPITFIAINLSAGLGPFIALIVHNNIVKLKKTEEKIRSFSTIITAPLSSKVILQT